MIIIIAKNQKEKGKNDPGLSATWTGTDAGELWAWLGCGFGLLCEGDCDELEIKFSKAYESGASTAMSHNHHKFLEN